MTAYETCKAHRNDIARLMDVLGMELERLDTEAAKDQGDWSYAGTLGHIREQMVSLAAFASGKEASEVEQFLADAI